MVRRLAVLPVRLIAKRHWKGQNYEEKEIEKKANGKSINEKEIEKKANGKSINEKEIEKKVNGKTINSKYWMIGPRVGKCFAASVYADIGEIDKAIDLNLTSACRAV
jgi:hypothetical protein